MKGVEMNGWSSGADEADLVDERIRRLRTWEEIDMSEADDDALPPVVSIVKDSLSMYFVPAVGDGVLHCEVFGFRDGRNAGTWEMIVRA